MNKSLKLILESALFSIMFSPSYSEELSDIRASDPAIYRLTAIYVTHSDDKVLTEIIDDKILNELPLNFSAHYLVRGGSQLYMANSTNVSTLINQTPVPIFDVPPPIIDLIAHNNELYIAHGRTVSILVNGKNICNIVLPYLLTSAAIKGKEIYVMHGNTLSIIADHKIVKDIEFPLSIFCSEVFEDPYRTFLGFMGKEIYLTEYDNHHIYRIFEDKVIHQLSLKKTVGNIAWIGQQLYVAHPDNRMVSIIVAERKIEEIEVGDFPEALAVVGRKMYVSNRKGSTLSVISDYAKIQNIELTKYPSALATMYRDQSLFYMLANLENQLARPILYDVDIISYL